MNLIKLKWNPEILKWKKQDPEYAEIAYLFIFFYKKGGGVLNKKKGGGGWLNSQCIKKLHFYKNINCISCAFDY